MTRQVRTVLVMNEDENVAAFVRSALGSEGYRVVGTSDSSAGISQAREQRPDLIVVDICTPRRPGLYTLRDLKKDPQTRGIPVIILSCVGSRLGVSASAEQLCRFLGIDSMALLEMPVEALELREMTERLLDSGPGTTPGNCHAEPRVA